MHNGQFHSGHCHCTVKQLPQWTYPVLEENIAHKYQSLEVQILISATMKNLRKFGHRVYTRIKIGAAVLNLTSSVKKFIFLGIITKCE